MSLIQEIEAVYAERKLPVEIVAPKEFLQFDSDVMDALWFVGRSWREITWGDWQRKNAAITFFSAEAFAYYLASVMALSAQRPEEWLHPAGALIGLLDRSPDSTDWDDDFTGRFVRIRGQEFEILKEWLLYLSGFSTYKLPGTSGAGDNFGRAFDTVILLQTEIERKRLPDTT